MKYRLLLILSLLFFTVAQSRTVYNLSRSGSSNNTSRPSPVYYNDAIRLITSEYNSSKIDKLISLSRDIKPIQIGAFKQRSNAEKMYFQIAEVLGEDVVVIEEDGFYKVRVTTLDKDKIRDFLEPEDNLSDVSAEDQAAPFLQDTIGIAAPVYDSVSVMDTTRDLMVAASPPVDSSSLVVQTKEVVRKYFLFSSNSPWLKRINYFGKSFALVNALIITIVISIATMFIMLFLILLNRAKMEKEESLKQYLAETYQGMIIDYLFTDSNPDIFRPIASDTYRRQALIDQMIDVSVNLKGDAEEKLGGLYLYLGLDGDSIKRAHDFRWHKKIKGFRELAFMNIKDANDEMYKALNSKNEILRMEAQIALVRLSDEEPMGFLFDLKRPFSLWEQITLHELIIQHDLPVPEFRKFLKADNPTVVMFALRMIREFKQREAEDDVREALDHPSPEVRQIAVQVAGDLDMSSTLETMKRMYKNQDYHTCVEIIRAMAKMPDPSLMGFLKLVLDKEDDVQLQIEATKAIENNGEEGVRTLVKLMKSEYKNYNIIVRHVLDRRIF
ncbi:MAG: HEAT repeat domain-containing protein [Bacteroidales bacterium]